MKVISAGNCDFDGPKIATLVSVCGGDCIDVSTVSELKTAIAEHAPALILFNRILDLDQTQSIPLIAKMKADENYKQIPMMLISNYEESQAEAVAAGALPGFGKNALEAPETAKLIKDALLLSNK